MEESKSKSTPGRLKEAAFVVAVSAMVAFALLEIGSALKAALAG